MDYSSQYQVGGTLSSTSSTYISRPADNELLDALLNREVCYVFNSRQMGKSSLLLNCKRRLEEREYKCCFLDLSKVGSHNISPEQWYAGIVFELWRGFKIASSKEFFAFWESLGPIPPPQKLSLSLQKLTHVLDEELAIFFDEVDCVKSLDFPPDDFFSVIRAAYNVRTDEPSMSRLQFAFFGVALPSDLISDTQRSPFNIGKAIELRGLTLESCSPLQQGLQNDKYDTSELLGQVLHWTNGQPFLTQKICQILQNELPKLAPSEDRSVRHWVETIIEQYLIDDWQAHDTPEHLKTISDRLLVDPAYSIFNLETYKTLLLSNEHQLSINDETNFRRFELTGLVNIKGSVASLRAELYGRIFTLDWVNTAISKHRPYQSKFSQWLADKDDEYLLNESELSKVLTWSADKHLPEIDHLYISASQFQEKQKYHLWNQRLEQEVAQRKKTEKELNKALGKLEEAKAKADGANQAKSEFIARISHQVRTPINHIMGLSYLAEQNTDIQKVQQYIQKISKSTSYLLGTVNDLIDINKLEKRELTLHNETIIIEDLIDSIIDLVSERCEKESITLKTLFPSSPLPIIKSDPLRLQQILINLITNAINFSGCNEVCIKISCQKQNTESHQLNIEVTDDGLGINQLTYSNHPLSDDDTFIGLGLRLCIYLSNLIESQILLNSTPTAGSSFTFSKTIGKDEIINQPVYKRPAENRIAISTGSISEEVAETLTLYGYETTRLDLPQLIDGFDLNSIDTFLPLISELEEPEKWITYFEDYPEIQIIPLIKNGSGIPKWITGTRALTELTWPSSPKRLAESLSGGKKTMVQNDRSAYELMGNYKLLLVDDDEINQEIILELLKDRKIQIDCASNGLEAVNMDQKHHYDLVLMDIEMPILNGIEATKELRKMGMQKPIIAMTAHALLTDEARFKSAGMNDYLSKPIKPERLYQLLSNWLPKEIPENIQTLSALFPKIAISYGIKQCDGNISLYKKLLERFIQRFSNEVELEKLNKDEFNIIIKSIRDQAKNLGINSIEKLAASILVDLETINDIKIQKIKILDKALNNYLPQLSQIIKKLDSIDQERVKKRKGHIVIHSTEVNQIKKLHTLLNNEYKILIANTLEKLDQLILQNDNIVAIISSEKLTAEQCHSLPQYDHSEDTVNLLKNKFNELSTH